VRIGADEEIDDTKGLKPEEINERIQEKEAKAHAQILEMVSSIAHCHTDIHRCCRLQFLNPYWSFI